MPIKNRIRWAETKNIRFISTIKGNVISEQKGESCVRVKKEWHWGGNCEIEEEYWYAVGHSGE